ncbi:MAG: rRNA cytosine-C5-methyltransferase [Tannerellaceae bacterium]|jgi:16S rRNA C967 or C1407 C5-methylase (RsmB/RsmF family)/NOL1/NOP2/fmu family ribosome biogenesis protein|nr:rRNA cytosine-C5-methyltransferase [Tannerellaceae bacterium]
MTLPPDFITRTRHLLGEETFRHLSEALKEAPPVSIRINRTKGAEPPDGERVVWCSDGYYLPERPSFTFDPLFHAGAFYVQEASSMFPEQVVAQYVKEPVICLDLCAAPGGKSTHLASLLPEGSLLVSNEVIRSRSHILSENLTKWGNPYSIVTNNDPEEIGRLKHLFDVILTDVPCSGEGMFRKDPGSVGEWSVANVNLCASRQRRILYDVWNALKPGGLLIYSTCTYNTEENEDNILYMINELGADPLPVATREEWNIAGALKHGLPACRFFPHRTKGEGFFLAAVRKHEEELRTIRHKSNGKGNTKGKGTSPVTKAPSMFLKDFERFSLETRGEFIRAFPLAHQDTYMLLQNHLRIVSAGIRIGEVKGKDIVPDQSLALSTSLNRNAFPIVELSAEEAIRYLRKEALLLPVATEKGYVLLTYKGFPLGFVKNLGNRANNLYPQEWRIRKAR